MRLNILNKSDFEPHLNSLFQVRVSEREGFEVTLISVDDIPLPLFRVAWATTEAQSQRAPFSLTFRFPAGTVLSQGMYHFSHPTLGELPTIFITPIGQDAHSRYYEAVFN